MPELKKLVSQEDDRGYLLGLGEPANHAMALYLRSPFHFLDPSNGIALAESEGDLVLFLASYITEIFLLIIPLPY